MMAPVFLCVKAFYASSSSSFFFFLFFLFFLHVIFFFTFGFWPLWTPPSSSRIRIDGMEYGITDGNGTDLMDGTITLFLLLSSGFPYSLSCFFISLFFTQKEFNDLGRPFLFYSYSFSCTLCLFCGFGCLVRKAFWFGGFIIAYVRCVLWDCAIDGGLKDWTGFYVSVVMKRVCCV
jgi:hypothetical protein